ncbi:HNH endonuclease [Bacillus tropicus]|uniref:HNH endonuclease n=1 Tax=Bacillus tropicus TaxID=2026188 RepID=UPI000CD9594A|nr:MULTISPECIES: HNH endonuclease [Bacillus cereus group]MCU5423648.1 HNH endonuclease [Bacillus tropicus]
MSYYVVMHGQTAKKVMEKNIIWAPKSNGNGLIHHWERVKGVKKGDIIFQFEHGKITAIAKALTNATPAKKPEILKETDWPEEGYLVNVQYSPLRNPLVIKEHLEELRLHFPSIYSPFQENGKGNQGYLYPCNDLLALEMICIIRLENQDKLIMHPPYKNLETDVENTKRALVTLEETQYETTATIRKGQQAYKKGISALWEHKCPICGIKETNIKGISLLIGSHSKPWKDSEPGERHDEYNGILLCKNHDGLYDKGLITFDESDGRIIISKLLPEQEYDKYNLNKDFHLPFDDKHKKYLHWHKTHVYEKFMK